MSRRIVTAREQAEMLTPWQREAMPAQDAYDSGQGPTGTPDIHPGPWYHSSDHDLPDGTILTPGGGESQWSDLYGDDKQNRANWVWMGKDPHETSNWGTNTYEVEPMDEGPWPWNGFGGDGHVSPRARVIRKHDFTSGQRTAAPWYSKPGDQTYQVPTGDLLKHRQFNPSPSTPEDMFNTLYRTPWSSDGNAQPYRRPGDTDFHSGGGDEGSRNGDDIVDAFESGQGHKLPPVEITTNGVGATLTDGNHRAETADMMSQPDMASYIHYNPHGQMDDDDFESAVDPNSALGKHIHQLVQNHPYEPLGDNAPSTRYVFRQHPDTGQWQRGRVDHHSPPQFVDNEDYAHQMMQDVPGYKHDGLGTYHTVDWGDGPELTNQRHLHARKTAAGNEDYAMSHQSPGPDSGFPVWDMAGEHGGATSDVGGVPADWYTHPQYYSYGEVSPQETKRVQQTYNNMRGNPDHMVDIYRALPHGKTDFNTGDWVTPSLEYARGHAVQNDDPANDWPVIKTQVPASHLYQNGDSYYEWGYHGPKTPGQVHGLHEAGFHSDLMEYRNERERQERALEEATGNYGGDVADYFARGGQPLITYKDWMKGKKGQGEPVPMDPNFVYTPEPGHDYEPPW